MFFECLIRYKISRFRKQLHAQTFYRCGGVFVDIALLDICFTGGEALVQCLVLDCEDTCVCRNSRS
jgi:hypothetical protein